MLKLASDRGQPLQLEQLGNVEGTSYLVISCMGFNEPVEQ